MVKNKPLHDFLVATMPRAIKDDTTQRELIAAAQAGDTAAHGRLVVGSVGLVVKAAKPYFNVGEIIHMEPLDLVMAGLYGPKGDGTSGMARAAMLFDLSRSCRLSTYATYWITDALQRAVRLATTRFPESELRIRMVPLEDDEPVDPDPTPLDALFTSDLSADLTEALEQMPPRTRQIIHSRYVASRSLQQVADELGMSREYVRKIEIAALSYLRNQLAGRYDAESLG
jgi:RNA polymerase sigma factor (sigma-70 family)